MPEIKPEMTEPLNFRAFFEVSPAMSLVLDTKLHIVAISDGFTKAIQTDRNEILGKPLVEVLPESQGDSNWSDIQNAIQRVLESRTAVVMTEQRLNIRQSKSEGGGFEERYWRPLCSPVLAGNGSVAYILYSIDDITERVIAKRRLHEREEWLRAILDTAADAIITIDERGTILSASAAATRMFGYPLSALIGNNISILMPSPYRDEHDSYIARYLTTGEPRIIGVGRELTGRRSDGSHFAIELSVSNVDHLRLFTGIIRDISESKLLRRHILEIAEEVQRTLGQELHDGIQQELTGLSLFAGVLADGLMNATERESVNEVGHALKPDELAKLQRTSQRLVEGLKATTKHVQKISHGIMPVQIDSEGLRDALQSLALSMNSENLECRFECANSQTVDLSNTAASHLYRIAQEACTNSMRHGQATKIQITLSATHASLELEVCDNGIGFDPAAKGAARGPIAGMGRRIMEYRAGMIGGVIRFERRKEGGMCMSCRIPYGVPVA